MTLKPDDFHCWCQAPPGHPCNVGTSEAGDLELKHGRFHRDRLRAARDANAALRKLALPVATAHPAIAKYAAYSPANGWLVDLCVGATWCTDMDDATWFDSPAEIDAAFKIVELDAHAFGVIPVRVK